MDRALDSLSSDCKPSRRRRAVVPGYCTKCQQQKPLDQFRKRKNSSGNLVWHPWCRGCRSSCSLSWARNHKDHCKVVRKRFLETHPERCKEIRQQYTEHERRGLKRLRDQVFAHYGECCACCGE